MANLENQEGFNKLQYSVFVGSKAQYVVRSNDEDEFARLKDLVDNLAKLDGFTTPAPQAPTDLGKCPKCGAEMIHNPKTGKNFCKDKCWLKNEF